MVSPGCTVVPALGVVVSVATGGRLPTVTLVVVDVLNAPGSVTVRVGVKVVTLGVTYWWVGLAAVVLVPSPKSQAYVSAPPSGSTEPALEKVTIKGEYPALGVTLALATGDVFAAPLKRMRPISPETDRKSVV